MFESPPQKEVGREDFDLISWAAKNLSGEYFFRWTNSKWAFSLKSKMKIPLWCLAHWTYPTYSEKGVCQFCLVVSQPDVCTSLSNQQQLLSPRIPDPWFSILNGLVVSLLLLPLYKVERHIRLKKHIFGGSLWFNAGCYRFTLPRFLVLENRGSRPLFGSS